MPNTGNPSGTQTGRPDQLKDGGRQWQGSQNEEQDDTSINDEDGNVEVGDPVPENQRTIRASGDGQGLSNGQGESGEDEGLSGDSGDNERH